MYNHKVVEKKWQDYWAKHDTFKTGTDPKKKNYYALDMFPFPSGKGLHVGHPEGYTATDIVSRMKRAQGYNVLHPMGWDAFGLPTEQYALKTGEDPEVVTKNNIANFKRQLNKLGFSYDWDREVTTSDPNYYKWTQWVFEQMYKKGLAYEAEVPVNWSPDLGTVVANEEVIDGKTERGGYPVYRKNMRQWMLKMTAYADRLLIACNALQVPDVLEQVVELWMSKGNLIDDLQVLAPMYKGVAGIDNLNSRMQAIVNPAKHGRKEVQVNQQVFRIGDRVLQLVNDPEHNIFNGDIGKVIGIDLKNAQNHIPADKIIVDFDGNEVGYEKRNWNQLTLAYCMSIHKSQGGEFPLIILPMVRQFSRMFARNLLYTAVSRAKQKLVLLGEVDAFERSVSIVSSNRQTGLKEMLWEAFGDHEKINLADKTDSEKETETAKSDEQVSNQDSNVLTNSLIESGKIDPMIGMNGIQPKDFMETKPQGVTKH